MKALFLIPARGGSKGIPGKNTRKLANHPLICYSIDAARGVAGDEDIVVSTDDVAIKNVAEEYGLTVPFLRPAHLASDEASMEGVMRHALEFMATRGKEYDYLVVLQPTSPLRKSEHISEALQLVEDDTEMIVSVKKTKSNPYYVLFEEKNGLLFKSKQGNFVTRQECPEVYELNGAIYIINVAVFKDKPLKDLSKKKYEMSSEDSLDIDSELDWLLCELLLKSKQPNAAAGKKVSSIFETSVTV